MSNFTLHTLDSAPPASRPLLEGSLRAYGMVPNLHAVMAESPEHLDAYQQLHEIFQHTSLSAAERNVVWLTINVEHRCHYCVPAHTAIAKSQGLDAASIAALREGRALADAHLEALRQFTLKLVRQRGEVAPEDIEQFLAAGFTRRNVLDILVGLAQKVMSNYVNHLAATPLDAPFAAFAWSAPRSAAA
ncbi:MAG: carboxymuconolactone decarboxylase family protein [Pseudomonadota bacterium]|jgi:uncharacterized peroxidase-related enzyme|nr:carboxymuconolactone decarboxylase family protein [Pseudomonadota bacterium]